jgi:hypothetical protein
MDVDSAGKRKMRTPRLEGNSGKTGIMGGNLKADAPQRLHGG